jgi:hypothetical protein
MGSIYNTSEQHEILRVSFTGIKLNFPEDDNTQYDTYLEIYKRFNKEWILHETTEIVRQESNPRYKKKVEFDYYFEDVTRF